MTRELYYGLKMNNIRITGVPRKTIPMKKKVLKTSLFCSSQSWREHILTSWRSERYQLKEIQIKVPHETS